ncbi:MAG: carboxymuconolactone decarboxylase family protein [Planctomycetes bacterium]|nr:carboxymuconolactone decarboxylase family protein [Planctomycetota bacterium]
MKRQLEFTEALGRKVAAEYPSFVKGLVALDKAGMAPGALSRKTKELIALALSVQKECTYCIAWHVRGALKEGATKDEIMEAAFVACVLGGGPAWMYAKLVHKAVEDLSPAS